FRRATLENEDLLIRRFFQRIIDEKCEVQITLAKDIPRNHWPDLNELRFDEDKSINFKIEQLMVQKSQFNLEREKEPKSIINTNVQKNSILESVATINFERSFSPTKK